MQENKNLVLAIVLCLIVLFGWGYLSEYMGWAPPRQTAPEKSEPVHKSSPVPAEPSRPVQAFKPVPGKDVTVDSPLYTAIFHTGGGFLKSFYLKKYTTGIEQDSPQVNLVNNEAAAFAPLGLVINTQPSWSTGEWSTEIEVDTINVTDETTGILKLFGLVDGLKVERHFEFDASTYLIRERVTLTNTSDHSRNVRLSYTQAMDAGIASGGQYDNMLVAWDDNGTLEDESSSDSLKNGIQATGQIYWAGPMSTYFIAASIPSQSAGATVKGLVAGNVFRVALEQEDFMLNAGQTQTFTVSYWLGPKERAEMAAVSEQLAKSINFGFFSIIGKFLIWVLEIFYRYVHNWGVAIILLTVALRILFWPLTSKSAASMEKMRKLQPMMQAIREKYKNNREEMNKEFMALYKSHKVSPASGCVPVLIQMPIFFGLYQALLSSIALRHAYFIPYLPGTDIVWLADLSTKDPLYITPLLMGLAMFLQQRMSPPPADPMQQKIMLFLPLIFTVLFLGFPSGLVLYWLVNNILQIFQQWYIMKKLKKGKPAGIESKKPSRQ